MMCSSVARDRGSLYLLQDCDVFIFPIIKFIKSITSKGLSPQKDFWFLLSVLAVFTARFKVSDGGLLKIKNCEHLEV